MPVIPQGLFSQPSDSFKGDGDAEDVRASGADPGGDPDDEPEKKIYSKSDLYKAYAGKGTTRMFAEFVGEEALHRHAIIIEDVGRPLETAYNDDLDIQRQSQADLLKWAADRCMGGRDSWWGTVSNILLKQHDKRLMQKLGMVPSCNPPVSIGQPWIQDDVECLKLVVDFANCLGSRIAWSEMMFRYTLPHGLAFMLSTSPSKRKTSMELLQRIVKIVVRVEEMILDKSAGPMVLEAYHDLGWPQEPLPREIMMRLLQCDFDSNDKELRRLATRYFAGSSTTTDILERAFAHLSDIAARSSKNKKMSQHSVWFYASTSPYVKKSGMQQCLPAEEDWQTFSSLTVGQSKQTKIYNSAFKAKQTKLPAEGADNIPKTTLEIKKNKGWRNAGSQSHHISVAAIAYLLHDEPFDFKNGEGTWAGSGSNL